MKYIEIKIIIIHSIALSLVLFSVTAKALDYDVDWPTSDRDSHTLAITINGCETRFKIMNKDFKAFTTNNEALKQALDKAKQRSQNGCKN